MDNYLKKKLNVSTISAKKLKEELLLRGIVERE
jgi:hypothetical protein